MRLRAKPSTGGFRGQIGVHASWPVGNVHVSNPSPLRPFREDWLAARLEGVPLCKAKSLGYFLGLFLRIIAQVILQSLAEAILQSELRLQNARFLREQLANLG